VTANPSQIPTSPNRFENRYSINSRGTMVGEQQLAKPPRVRMANLMAVLAISLLVCRMQLVEASPSKHVDLPHPPNIVFILIDDMGWPDVACYGHPFHETPTIDRLCAEGLKFTDFYAATPVCSSTRATIQSGQYSARVGITDFIPGHFRPFEKLVVPPIENALPESIRTPGDQLRKAGYTTGYFGKWHLGTGGSAGP
jgi:arylsulfatase A